MSGIAQDPRVDRLVDAILAGDEREATAIAAGLPDGRRLSHSLQEACSLGIAAMVGAVSVPPALQQRLAANALHFCADRRRTNLAAATRQAPAADRRRWHLPLGLAAGVAVGLLASRWAERLPNPRAQMQAMLASGAPLVRQPWQAGPGRRPSAIGGEVVWSDGEQRGYLRCQGLPALPPERQFQLWIVDAEREGAPVDGGLFEVPATAADAVIPMQARLHIGRAAAFVITVERRGGVVVSKQEDVVAIASR